MKSNEMSFAETWMDLDIITLSEVSHREKDKCLSYHLYVESKKNATNSFKTETDSQT